MRIIILLLGLIVGSSESQGLFPNRRRAKWLFRDPNNFHSFSMCVLSQVLIANPGLQFPQLSVMYTQFATAQRGGKIACFYIKGNFSAKSLWAKN